MSCLEFEIYASAMCDGEPIPAAAARHISGCASCQSKVNAYAELGAQLRQAASLQHDPESGTAGLLEAARARGSSPWSFLSQRTPVPRYSLALVTVLIVSLAVTSLVRAQSRPMWFLFGITTDPAATAASWTPAQDGYDDQMALSRSGPTDVIVIRVRVNHVSETCVSLRATARGFGSFPDTFGYKLPIDDAPTLSFTPGHDLDIPVEGGGTVRLVGRILDHQPRIAWGLPLELEATQFVIRSPVLVSEIGRIADIVGATAIARADKDCVFFAAGAAGNFLFALREFPGAVKAQLNWGDLSFRLDGKQYRLVTPAPMTGGEQPATAWVRHDPPMADLPASALGVLPLPR